MKRNLVLALYACFLLAVGYTIYFYLGYPEHNSEWLFERIYYAFGDGISVALYISLMKKDDTHDDSNKTK